MVQVAPSRSRDDRVDPPPRTRGDKRRQILDAAAPVFGDRGYERASVDAIASVAGVSKPTIYSHFGSKEQLFRDSVADSARALNADSLRAVEALDVATARWRRSLSQTALQLAACHRDDCARSLSRLVNAESARDPAVYASVRAAGYEPIVQALAGRLAMLANAGHLSVPDPVLAARQLMSLLLAELSDLTELGTVDIPEATHRAAVERGVETFVRAFATG